MTTRSRHIVSTLGADGKLTVELVEEQVPDPKGHEVLLRIDAAPINPADLGLMFGPALLDQAEFSAGKIVAPMPSAAVEALAGRVGQAIRIGSECAATVVAAGDAPEAQAMIGKRVSGRPGGIYANYRIADARSCLVLPDDLPIEYAAASFVNPMTAVCFVETMRQEGFTAIVHTAAASNLGQMMVRLCKEEGIDLVNVVRKPEQAELLKSMGARHVVDSSQEDFAEKLVDAIAATGARLAFDAIGGGTMASRLLSAMNAADTLGKVYDRYGSDQKKKVYIYGTLDFGPTILDRSFGFTWDVSGWLVMRRFMAMPQERREWVQKRVVEGLRTTFASTFKHRIGLDQLFERDVALTCNAKTTGEKCLMLPNG